MTRKGRTHVPSVSSAAVKARTGKDWATWFQVLDREGAAKLDHRSIASLLSRKYRLPGWWAQTVTVEYERARGLRQRHENTDGFSVAVSRTMATSLSGLYAATANEARRRSWFPRGAFEPSSQTRNKYFRGRWNRNSRLEIGFYGQGADKSRIAVQVRKLPKKADVEQQRKAWKSALAKLEGLLESDTAGGNHRRRKTPRKSR